MPDRYRIPPELFIVAFGFILLAVCLVVGIAFRNEALPVRAETLPVDMAQLPNNAACLSCHMVEDQIKEFPNGDVISVVIAPEMYGLSAHATLSCQVCHTNISGYPHPENLAQSSREYTLQFQNTCNQCHPSQASELMDSVHTRLMAEGNLDAPICADCHNPHQQPKIAKDEQGRLSPAEHAQSAMVCGQCHSTIYDEYARSVHGSGVLEDKNPDVPSCIDCHGVHNVSGPSGGAAFRLSSPKICADCHTNEQIMSKYGLSTQVLQTYVADFHGTTVTLFEKLDPDQQINMPVCYDCHGVHDIRRSDDPEKGLQVKQNLLAACQKCHPDATENFPDAWLSHYIPDRNRYPLVYWVNEFYKYFIPTVLGGMGLFVVSDIYRRWVLDRRRKNAKSVEGAEDQMSATEETSKDIETEEQAEQADTQFSDEKPQDEENS
jgi:hypothetical protein